MYQHISIQIQAFELFQDLNYKDEEENEDYQGLKYMVKHTA